MMGIVGCGGGARRVLVVLSGLAVVAGTVAVNGPRVEAEPDPPGDETTLPEPEPVEVDRDQEQMQEAIDEAEEISEAEAASQEVELPPGALDGTAGPDLFGEDDPSILRPTGDDGVVYPSAGDPGSVPVEVVDDGVPDLPEESPEDLTAALEATSESVSDGGDPGQLVEEARQLDTSDLEPGDEVEELRTVDSRTFVNVDGTFRTELGSEPMFGEDAGGDLVEADATPRGGRDERWRPTAGRPGLSFGATARDARLGSLSFGEGRSVSWSLDGASRAPGREHADGVRYEDVFDGVDLEMEATLTGVKETIVIADASAPTTYEFPLDLTGVTAELDDPYGSVVLTDAESGQPVGVIPSAWAQDAGQGPNGETPDPGPVAYALVGEGADAVLRVTVDEVWFRDPARVFPVRIDPNVDDYRFNGDTWVHNQYPTTNRSTSPILKTGGGGGNRRTYFARWDVGWLAAATILDARYATFNSYSYSCNAAPLQIYRVTSNWNPATVTWNTQPSRGGLVGQLNESHGYSSVCPAARMHYPMTGLVQTWVDGTNPAYGITGRVAANDGYDDNNTYKEFIASEGGGDGGQILQVVWSPWRVRYAVASSLTPPTATQSGSIRIRVTNRAPTTWISTGANRYRLGYHVYQSDGTTLVTWNGGQVDLPQDVSWGESVTVTVPIGALPVGNYQIKFDMVQNGVGWFSGEGIHADLTPLAIRVPVGNTPPVIEHAAPAGQVETRTPTLSVVGSNPDSFPSGSLQYSFQICGNEAMTTGCQSSGWISANRWTPANLVWAKTYYWNAGVRETGSGGLTTNPSWKAPLTPTLAQPILQRHFGSDPYAPLHGGVNPSIGNYVTSSTDVQVATAGLPVELTRTYNSMDTRVGAFGPGWSTFLDLSATSESGGKLLIGFPDGHQERYGQNPDGSWAPPPGSSSVLRSVNPGGWELQRPDRMTYKFNAAGQPTEIRDGYGNALQLRRNGSGLVDRVTNQPSGRYMDLEWHADGPSGAQVVTAAQTSPAAQGETAPRWTYSYSSGRLTQVCAPGEPVTNAQCTAYDYYGSGQGTLGRLHTITRQEGNVTVELSYATDGTVAWLENGTDDRWTFTDDDDAADGTYHPIDGFQVSAAASIGANSTITVDVTGSGGVPGTGVQAVAVDVGAAGSTTGWLSLYPSGTSEPAGVSTMEYFGEARSTLNTVAVGDDGTIKVANHGQPVFVNFEIVGWYAKAGISGGSVFVPLPTNRILDTRVTGGPIGAGQTRQVQVTGAGGVPTDGVTAVVYDLEGLAPTATTSMTAYAVGASRPGITTLSLNSGRTMDNLHITRVGTGGKIALYNSTGSINVNVDVVGYFTDPDVRDGNVFRPVTNQRLLNTSTSNGQWTTPWPAGGTRPVTVVGEGTLPARGVAAAVGDVQAINPAATNPMRSGPSGATNGGATYLAQPSLAVGNSFYTGLGSNGAFDLWSQFSVDVIVDLVGYFAPIPRTTFVEDPRGHTVEYRYDEQRRLVSRIDEESNATAWAYDDDGFVGWTGDTTGTGHGYTYDDDGHLLTDTAVDFELRWGEWQETWRSRTYYGYVDDPANPARDGKLAGVADGRSADATDTTYRTTYDYDTSGQPTAVRGPALAEGTAGVGVSRTYANGTTVPAACPTSLGVGPAGLLQTQTDAANLTTVYCYDPKGDLREVHHPSGLVDRYTYDDLGRAISHTVVSDTYPNGVTAATSYDAQGRVIRELGPRVTSLITSPPDGQYHRSDIHVTYTPNGNIDRVTTADFETGTERWIDYGYDLADRPTDTIDNADRTTHRTYDPNGNLATQTGVDGLTLAYDYNWRNLVSFVTAQDVVDDPIGAPNTTRDITFQSYLYDGLGRRVREVTASGNIIDYAWRADGRLEYSSSRLHHQTDPDTGLDTGTRHNTLLGAAQMDLAGNTTVAFTPTDLATVDEFDGATLSNAWQTSGSWSLSNGSLVASSPGIAWRSGATDGQVTVPANSSDLAHIGFRIADPSNYIDVNWTGTTLTVSEVVDGVKNTLAQDTLSLEEGDRVEVSYTGDKVRVLRGGSLNLEATIPVGTGGTGVGIAADTAGPAAGSFRFDAYERTENTFDPYGRLVASTEDPGGANLRTEWSLLPDGRPSAVFRSNAAASTTTVAATRYGYNPTSGLLDWSEDVISDPDSEVNGDEVVARTTFAHDQRGLVTGTVSPEGAQTGYTYDEIGQLARVTGPARTVERYGQSAQPNVRPTETYGYTAFGERSLVQDVANRTTVASFDERGFPTTTTLPSYTPPGGSPIQRVISTEFDDAGRLVSRTDPRNETTELTYNTLGLLVARQDPAVGSDPPGVWRYVYDDMGWLLEQRDPTGGVVWQRWDDLGRVTGVEEIVRQPSLASYVTGFSIGDAGDVLRTHTAEGVVTTANHDLAGRLTRQADADGNATTYAYDELGRLAQVTSPDGRQARATYDLVDNTLSEQFYAAGGALLGESRYTWDKDRHLRFAASPRGVAEGFATEYTYDPASQLTSRRTPVAAGQTVVETWGYDELGNATRYTDGRNNATWQTYNSMRLPEDAIEPAAGAQTAVADRRWRTLYDAAGAPTSQQAPGGVTVSSSYDDLGRLVQQAGSGGQASTATRGFDYDTVGRLTSASSSVGSQTFTYDDRGLLQSSTGVAGSSSFSYDGDGQVTQRTDSSGTSSFTYDDRGLPDTMISSLGGTVSYDFDAAARPETMNYGGGTTRTFTYDDWGRVDIDRLATGANTLYAVDYGYDQDGDITSKAVSGAGVSAAGTNQYSYDRAARITSWSNPAGTSEGYGWDAASNRTQIGATTATYDEQDRLARTEGPGGLTTNTWLANGTLDQQNVQRRVSLVVANPASLTAAENVLLFDLVASGKAVTLVDDAATVPTSGVDVFVISPSVDMATLGTKYRDVAVPVVNLAAGTWQNSGLTNAAPTSSSSASAFVSSTGHPVAAGKTGTVTLLSSADTISSVAASNLGTGASRVWTSSSSSTNTVVAVYDKAGALPTGTAAERRVTVGLSPGAVTKINTDGWALIDAAIAWADNNTATFGTTNFDFDAFEQLARVTVPSGTATSYSYDPVGRRLSSPTGTLSYAGTAIRPSSDGASRYQFGPVGSIGIDDMTNGGGTWAHADGHTDVVGSFNPGAPALVASQAFSPWGQTLGTSGAPLPLGYQSERQDLPGGLIGMGVRAYNPSTGTFISHDPANDPTVPNGYSYTSANPLGYTDPTGLGLCDPLICAALKGLFGGGGSSDSSARSNQASTDRYSGAAQYWSNVEQSAISDARNQNPWADICRVLPSVCPPDSGGSDRPSVRGPGHSPRNGGGDQHGDDRASAAPQRTIFTDPSIILRPPAAEDSATAKLVKATGSAVPNYPGRIQTDPTTGQRVDTGNASMATTPVDVVSDPPTQAPAPVPEVVINLVSDQLNDPQRQPTDPALRRGQQPVGNNQCGYAQGKGDVTSGQTADITWTPDPLAGCSGSATATGFEHTSGRASTGFIDLYHATSTTNASLIRAGGIDLAQSRQNLDFGAGFYTTTDRGLAESWAVKREAWTGMPQEILHYRIPLTELRSLAGRTFDAPSAGWEVLVRSQRGGDPLHNYAYVEGPMAKNIRGAKWDDPTFDLGPFGHQLSIHTPEAVELFNRYLR
jgi:RHS repeat-associated protein